MSLSESNLERILNEMNQIKQELKNAINASETRLHLKIEESQERVRHLEIENIALKKKIEILERRQNSNNIVIFGLNKERNEITFDLIREKLKSLIQVDVNLLEIRDICCLGSRKNCPVKVEFVSNITKRHILSNCKKLTGTGISINNDLTYQQRQELAVLRRHLNIHRQNKNKKSFIRGNKLVVDNIEYTANQLIEIEEKEENQERGNSAPSTPCQSLLQEVFEKDLRENVPLSTPTSSLCQTNTITGVTKKAALKPLNQNTEKIRTRSANERKK